MSDEKPMAMGAAGDDGGDNPFSRVVHKVGKSSSLKSIGHSFGYGLLWRVLTDPSQLEIITRYMHASSHMLFLLFCFCWRRCVISCKLAAGVTKKQEKKFFVTETPLENVAPTIG
jgi:hypothetical protein